MRPRIGTALLLLAFIAAACGQPADEAAEPAEDPSAALQPITDAYLAAWNTGDVAALDTLLANDFARYGSPTTSAENRDSLKQVILGFRETYPDLRIQLDEVVYAPDRIVSRWTMNGTNAMTGTPVTLSGLSLMHVEDGRATAEWVGADNAAVMEQLGYTFTPPDTTAP